MNAVIQDYAYGKKIKLFTRTLAIISTATREGEDLLNQTSPRRFAMYALRLSIEPYLGKLKFNMTADTKQTQKHNLCTINRTSLSRRFQFKRPVAFLLRVNSNRFNNYRYEAQLSASTDGPVCVEL